MSCMIPSLWLSYEMETSHILFITLCLMILPHWNKLQSTDHGQGQVSYPMCVESELGMALVDRGKEPFHGSFKNNTSTSCTSHCLTLQYKFAGTKEKLCYCADSIRNDTDAATCDKECPGDKNEVCGGEEGISFYMISSTETTAKEVTTQTLTTYTREMPTQTESKNKEGISTATVVYIVLPVVIVVSSVIALVICLIVRRRRVKRVSCVSYHTSGIQHSGHPPESGTGNNLDNDNLPEEHKNNKLSTTQLVSTAGESRMSAADGGTEYSTIISAESPQDLHTYGCLKTQPGIDLKVSSDYSHMTVTRNSSSDNTYSHIGNEKLREHSIDNESERDSTYNSLQASPQKHGTDKINKFESNHDALYDHAKAGERNLKASNADKYEHLNSLETEKVITGQGSSKGDKGSHVCESVDSTETDLYEEADQAYFILKPKK